MTALWLSAPPGPAAAQTEAAPATEATDTAPPAEASSDTEPADASFTRAELRKLLAPIALYPDDLLAQVLPATAYPVDIVLASRWLDKNKAAVEKGDFSGADAQSWDASVKALVRFPDVIKLLNSDLDATSDLGDAFVYQPDEVAAVIQDLRREAQKAGSLKSTPQQTVTVQQQPAGGSGGGGGNAPAVTSTDYIVIEPAEPGVIYVPSYDPVVVYEDNGGEVASGLIGFGVGVAVGAAVDNAWDWNRGWVYPPRWPGYSGYRPGVPGYRPGINNGNINIGNDINIGSGNVRPWRPDPGRYQPGQGSKPGLAGRPVGGKRPGGGVAARPGSGNRPNAGNVADRVGAAPGAAAKAAGAKAAIGKSAAGKPAIANKAAAMNKPAASAKAASAKKAVAAKKPAATKKAATAKKAAATKKPVATKKAASAKKAVAAKRPATRKPQAIHRVPSGSAFSGARHGGNFAGVANRGAGSRHSVSRPPSRPHVSAGGGRRGGGPVMRGGGGRRR